MKKRLLLLGCGLAGLMLFSDCKTSTNAPGRKTFKQAEVPAVYTEPRLRAEYLAMHYWDHFDFADTAFVGSAAKITEQVIVDFLSVFPYAAFFCHYRITVVVLKFPATIRSVCPTS